MPELTPAEFETFILGKCSIVHFWAPWNGYDRILRERLASVRSQLRQDISFAAFSFDLPENQIHCELYQLLTVPTLIAFREGIEVGRIVGMRDANRLVEEVQAILGEA